MNLSLPVNQTRQCPLVISKVTKWKWKMCFLRHCFDFERVRHATWLGKICSFLTWFKSSKARWTEVNAMVRWFSNLEKSLECQLPSDVTLNENRRQQHRLQNNGASAFLLRCLQSQQEINKRTASGWCSELAWTKSSNVEEVKSRRTSSRCIRRRWRFSASSWHPAPSGPSSKIRRVYSCLSIS